LPPWLLVERIHYWLDDVAVIVLVRGWIQAQDNEGFCRKQGGGYDLHQPSY
jgi:hypothetical protein